MHEPLKEDHQAFASALGVSGLAPIVSSTAHEAMAILTHHSISLVFCSDELLENRIDDLIRQDWRLGNRVPVVVISRHDDWDRHLDFLRCGAFDYVLYPVEVREVERVLRNIASLSTSRKDEPSEHFGTRHRSLHVVSQFSQG